MTNFQRETPRFFQQQPVPTGAATGATGDAKNVDPVSAEPENVLQNGASVTDDRVPTGTDSAANIEEELEYILTIPEAQQRIVAAGRKAPSDRSMQRYANDPDHVLRGKKVSTTQGQEFLFTPSSVDVFLATLPRRLIVSSVPTGAATGVAGDAKTDGDADTKTEERTASSGADSAANIEDVTTGEEGRTVGSVLLENAKLLGQLEGAAEGKEELIRAQAQTISFLQDELIEQRKHRGEVKDIADRMLGIIEGRSLPTAPKEEDPVPAKRGEEEEPPQVREYLQQ
ncbi:MAG: hypothetical protein RIC85_03875 [Gammaproteobacteria bacterium]